VYFRNIPSSEFLGFPIVLLRPPFFWNMALYNCATTTQNSETTWCQNVGNQSPSDIESHLRRTAISHLKFLKHIVLIRKQCHFNFMLAYHFILFSLFQNSCLEALIPDSFIMVEIPSSP
jgi:hypothetical protein